MFEAGVPFNAEVTVIWSNDAAGKELLSLIIKDPEREVITNVRAHTHPATGTFF